jgi:hypothetical protein
LHIDAKGRGEATLRRLTDGSETRQKSIKEEGSSDSDFGSWHHPISSDTLLTHSDSRLCWHEIKRSERRLAVAAEVAAVSPHDRLPPPIDWIRILQNDKNKKKKKTMAI